MIQKINITSKSFVLLILIVTGCTTAYKVTDFESLYGPSTVKNRVLTPQQLEKQSKQHKISYNKDIKPILDSRCVACHACYDAPCQLKLSSVDGLDRGASKDLVYDASRMSNTDPTRLFVDAKNTSEWRTKDFYPVLNERIDSEVAALDNSLLAKMIKLKRANPLPDSGKLPESFELAYDRELTCPTVEEFSEYQYKHPSWGMPYAMKGLTNSEEKTVLKWLEEGAKVEPLKPLSKSAIKLVLKWENYLNRSSLKEKLVARYIFEHLFIGNLHFKGHPDNEFYKLVRSRTPSGQPLDGIASIHAYDDPGVESFYYRLRPVVSTIVDKTHFVYELSDQRMSRYNQLFFNVDYSVSELPSYELKLASNPFKTFMELPYNSKYQFLLDDAQYFISGFIKGPSCRGQMALNSIRDQFWVVFTKPNKHFENEIADFVAKNSLTLNLPGQEGSDTSLFAFNEYDQLGEEFLKKKNTFLKKAMQKNKGFNLNFIWDGEGVNQNAALTIFRHFDSATVTKGLVGDTPLTAWVVDYTIFERLHYLLVAGFNVYGTAGHQIASRTYMDVLRMDGENNFLRFMPANQRQLMHDSWYQGYTGAREIVSLFNVEHETGVIYKTDNYKKEFFEQVRARLGKASGDIDNIYCKKDTCEQRSLNKSKAVDSQMRKLAGLKGLELKILPEMSIVRVNTAKSDDYNVYTLLLNKSLSNVSMLLQEGARRTPEKDTLTVASGFIGSYPNFFFNVEQGELNEFINKIKNSKTEADKDEFYGRFGIRRSNPKFWEYSDWFNQKHIQNRGLIAGIFDLSRYHNH